MLDGPDREPRQQNRPTVTPAVQIVAMVCITAIIITFLVMIFVVVD